MTGTEVNAGNAAFLQTATAVVQAIVSVGLLTWYVLAAHLDRTRIRRERSEDFNSLVMLCRDLGVEAREKTAEHRRSASAISSVPSERSAALEAGLAMWRRDMTVIYVCLNEAPHYEVRNPAFSIALTRLWMEVDARTIEPKSIEAPEQLILFLDHKLACICREIDAMAGLLDGSRMAQGPQWRLVGARKGGGKTYSVNGSVQEDRTAL